MTSLPLPSIYYPGGLQLLTSEALHAHRPQVPTSAAVTRHPCTCLLPPSCHQPSHQLPPACSNRSPHWVQGDLAHRSMVTSTNTPQALPLRRCQPLGCPSIAPPASRPPSSFLRCFRAPSSLLCVQGLCTCPFALTPWKTLSQAHPSPWSLSRSRLSFPHTVKTITPSSSLPYHCPGTQCPAPTPQGGRQGGRCTGALGESERGRRLCRFPGEGPGLPAA